MFMNSYKNVIVVNISQFFKNNLLTLQLKHSLILYVLSTNESK
jgi:hypothetical protein